MVLASESAPVPRLWLEDHFDFLLLEPSKSISLTSFSFLSDKFLGGFLSDFKKSSKILFSNSDFLLTGLSVSSSSSSSSYSSSSSSYSSVGVFGLTLFFVPFPFFAFSLLTFSFSVISLFTISFLTFSLLVLPLLFYLHFWLFSPFIPL